MEAHLPQSIQTGFPIQKAGKTLLPLTICIGMV
jgi:hypothetical protein